MSKKKFKHLFSDSQAEPAESKKTKKKKGGLLKGTVAGAATVVGVMAVETDEAYAAELSNDAGNQTSQSESKVEKPINSQYEDDANVPTVANEDTSNAEENDQTSQTSVSKAESKLVSDSTSGSESASDSFISASGQSTSDSVRASDSASV